MHKPVDLVSAIIGPVGIQRLARLVHGGALAVVVTVPIAVVTAHNAAFGMVAQGFLSLRVGRVEIDVDAVRAEFEMVGGKAQDRDSVCLDRCNDAQFNHQAIISFVAVSLTSG